MKNEFMFYTKKEGRAYNCMHHWFCTFIDKPLKNMWALEKFIRCRISAPSVIIFYFQRGDENPKFNESTVLISYFKYTMLLYCSNNLHVYKNDLQYLHFKCERTAFISSAPGIQVNFWQVSIKFVVFHEYNNKMYCIIVVAVFNATFYVM